MKLSCIHPGIWEGAALLNVPPKVKLHRWEREGSLGQAMGTLRPWGLSGRTGGGGDPAPSPSAGWGASPPSLPSGSCTCWAHYSHDCFQRDGGPGGASLPDFNLPRGRTERRAVAFGLPDGEEESAQGDPGPRRGRQHPRRAACGDRRRGHLPLWR